MFNFFEQPWTLVGAAVLVLFGVLTFRSVLPEKRRRRQWLIPLFVAAVAFGLDYLVETDNEKIYTLIATVVKAVEEENCDVIDAAIAEDYRDSHHNSKAELMRRCRRILSKPIIARNRERGLAPPLITPPTATVTLFTTTTFEKNSYVTEEYFHSIALFRVKLHFRKQADKTWLISRIDPLEVNKVPINWGQIN